jgi:hypothetical protein
MCLPMNVEAAEKAGKARLVNGQTFIWKKDKGEGEGTCPSVTEFRNTIFGQVMVGADGIVTF